MDPVDPKRRGRRLFGGRRRHEHAAEAEMDEPTTTADPDTSASGIRSALAPDDRRECGHGTDGDRDHAAEPALGGIRGRPAGDPIVEDEIAIVADAEGGTAGRTRRRSRDRRGRRRDRPDAEPASARHRRSSPTTGPEPPDGPSRPSTRGHRTLRLRHRPRTRWPPCPTARRRPEHSPPPATALPRTSPRTSILTPPPRTSVPRRRSRSRPGSCGEPRPARPTGRRVRRETRRRRPVARTTTTRSSPTTSHGSWPSPTRRAASARPRPR